MSNDDIILDAALRCSAEAVREYWKKTLGDAEYKRIVETTDPSGIYTFGGWPLKVELFKDEKKE